jgi:proteasome lid subunit RPN8/RPN11
MKIAITISISRRLLEAVLEGARRLHPKETILLLRGRKEKGVIQVSDLVVPPLATYGHGFASLPLHMLPIDFSLVGTVHSHPSGNLNPSTADLNHYFGVILMIVCFPYSSDENVAVYDRNGDKLPLRISA